MSQRCRQHPSSRKFNCECIYHEINWSYRSASSYVISTYTWIDKLQPPAISINHIRGSISTSCLKGKQRITFWMTLVCLSLSQHVVQKPVKLLYQCKCMHLNLLQDYYLRKTVPKNPTWQFIRLKQNLVLQIRWITNISTQKWFPKTAKTFFKKKTKLKYISSQSSYWY